MTPEQEKQFREQCNKDCDKMAADNNLSWCELSLYLQDEKDKGKTEFRLVVNADNTFYIHPLGKDGKTLDGKL